jgi:hypothetical protein
MTSFINAIGKDNIGISIITLACLTALLGLLAAIVTTTNASSLKNCGVTCGQEMLSYQDGVCTCQE